MLRNSGWTGLGSLTYSCFVSCESDSSEGWTRIACAKEKYGMVG